MRILVVNPNTTAAMTAEDRGGGARRGGRRDTSIDAVNPRDGTRQHRRLLRRGASPSPGLLEAIVAGERAGADGAVIACFDDTGLDAARSAVAMPVVGICEAAIHLAALARPALRDRHDAGALDPAARGAGRALRRRAPLPRARRRRAGAGAGEARHRGAVERIEAEIARGARARTAPRRSCSAAPAWPISPPSLSRKFGVPVIDGVAAAVKIVEALVGLGLRTSKTRRLRARRCPKPIAAPMAPFAPKPR